MEDILTKINKAYANGINNPRFKEAIEEMIKDPQREEEIKVSKKELGER